MNRISYLRKKMSMSQDELATKLKISRQAISLYEHGDREPKLATWEQLANHFDVPIPYLMGLDDRQYSLKFFNHLQKLVHEKQKKDPKYLPLLDAPLTEVEREYSSTAFKFIEKPLEYFESNAKLLKAFKFFSENLYYPLKPTNKGIPLYYASKILLTSTDVFKKLDNYELEQIASISDVMAVDKKIRNLTQELRNKYEQIPDD